MNLIEELKSYCDINNPVGALMLSGEWGCGKTYFIKKFIKSVKDTYVFVSISLFGIDSLDKLRVEVKKKWLEKASELDKLNGTKVSKIADSYKKVFGTIKDVLPENWQKKGEVVSSIMDLVNFVPISNRNPIRLYSLDEITEIFCKLGLRICNSFADFSGKPSSDNDIQLMVYSIRE